MKITVIKQTIALTKDDTLIRGAARVIPVIFSFDPTWDGFTKTVSFRAGAAMVSVPLENDRCNIPSECLKKAGVTLRVLVEGSKNGETIATPWCITSRVLYNADVDIPVPPSPGPAPTGEIGRLCEELARLLNSEYTEAELADLSLVDVVSDMDGLSNTVPDDQVDGMLDDVWGSSGNDSGPEPSGQVRRLCDEFADVLRSKYTEEELENMTLDEAIGNMDELGNTVPDDQVDGMLDDVWGSSEP